jgi:hypothetical protein
MGATPPLDTAAAPAQHDVFKRKQSKQASTRALCSPPLDAVAAVAADGGCCCTSTYSKGSTLATVSVMALAVGCVW